MRRSSPTSKLGVCAVVVLSVACSSGGGGGSAPPTYSVGGSVSGLLGTGLVLRNDGGDDLPISANGSFTFAGRLADGAAYAVTVHSLPANPPQTCSVTGGTGTIAAANVTGVSVACALSACAAGWGNCDGVDANGCETDLLTSSAHCGACDTPCAPAHASATCSAGQCQMSSCDAGWFDANANPADGCECQYQGATDLPDDGFVDANCDGIDGDVAAAIFVATSGNDANPGTMAAPKKTIGAGLAAAASAAKTQVYVSAGNYPETVVLRNGISIYGKYDASARWARSNASEATILAPASTGDVFAVKGTNITSPTTLDGLWIRSPNAATYGASSYGLHCASCAGLTVRGCDVHAGDGVIGTAGANGSIGANGGAALAGGEGVCDSTPGVAGGAGGASTCGQTGGAGGAGGRGATNGANGGTSAGGIAGGSGGAYGDPGQSGSGGYSGTNGANAANGAGGNGGTVAGGFWATAQGASGGTGASGIGGGGGGGGGGQSVFLGITNGSGNGGGGGGAGGCAGTGAAGGNGGGGSFGVFLVSSNGAALEQNTIASANGGYGGSGGTGGPGGHGGWGGSGGTTCTAEVGRGGNGGAGGEGGRGGHGGGGAGGPSYAVYRAYMTIDVAGNTLSHGAGGAGGTSSGNAGAAGASGDAN